MKDYACVSIGVRGCNEYDHYLDTFGVTMRQASKLSNTTGKELTEVLVNQAWKSVFNDLQIDGFKFNGISKSEVSRFNLENSTQKSYSLYVDTCQYEVFDLKALNIKVNGTLDIEVSINGSVQSGTYTNETIIISPSIFTDYFDFKLKAVGSGVLQNSELDYPFEIIYEVRCEEKLFYCNYSEWLIDAVSIKASALILNSALYSDRYNDFIIYRKEDIKERIVQLDSSFDVWSEKRRDGMYQLEIKRINDKLAKTIKLNRCNECCFECNSIFQTKIVTQ